MMRSTIFLMALALGAGCAGGETDAVSAASTAYVGHAEPLLRVDHAMWTNAPAGCEGRLHGMGLRWGVATNAPELVVALLDGVAVCVDTYSAIESELAAIDSPELDGLWAGYVTTLQELEPNLVNGTATPEVEHREAHVAVPHPQPSLEATAVGVAPVTAGLGLVDVAWDPRAGDPSPQPSAPGPSGSASTGSSTGSTSTSNNDGSAGMGAGSSGSSPVPPRGDDPRR